MSLQSPKYEPVAEQLQKRVIELELENFKLNNYKNKYLDTEESRQMMAAKLVTLETELLKCGKDVAALEGVVTEHAQSEIMTMEEIIDSMVFTVPVQKLGKKMFAEKFVYFKFSGYTGELEFIMTDTELAKEKERK